MVARKKRNTKNKKSLFRSVRFEGILLFVIGLYLLLSLVSPIESWLDILEGNSDFNITDSPNPGGPVGSFIAFYTRALLGTIWSYLFGAWLLWVGFRKIFLKASILKDPVHKLFPLILTSSAWVGQSEIWPQGGKAAEWGGVIGYYIAAGFDRLFGLWGSFIFLTFFLMTGLLLVLRPWLSFTSISPSFSWVGKLFTVIGESILFIVALPLRVVKSIWNLWKDVLSNISKSRETVSDQSEKENTPAEIKKDVRDEQPDEKVDEGPRKVHVPVEDDKPSPPKKKKTKPKETSDSITQPEDQSQAQGSLLNPGAEDVPLPPLDLLNDPVVQVTEVSEEELNASADLLEDTLKSFGVNGSVKDVRPGPVVTTFEYQPASGVKVNAIVQRADDLALAMRATAIRMEAPIPGKAAVGIEIPNPVQQSVSMREVIGNSLAGFENPLSVILGRDVFGDPITIDLAAQPHLLIAGSTGSGKSVCVNAMITSLLMHCDPSMVRLMLIDPKMLELNSYNGIPHLLHSVVTEPKKALRALKWLEAQMDFRYRRLAKHSVRDIIGYNEKVKAGLIKDQDGETITEPMPYYVCFVDELADLMVQLGQEVELPITRLAQKARAIGIHLVLATQRPSVDVLTGVIKANIPCRIAFKVVQMNDSRTVLDTKGAEKLLGKGDMLYLKPGRAQPIRVHGAYCDIAECDAVSEYWRNYADTTNHIDLEEAKTASGSVGGSSEGDELYERAREIVVTTQQGSTSMLQRKLSVGYARAGRLMDQLEEEGVVGPFAGSKAREVLMTMEDLESINNDGVED